MKSCTWKAARLLISVLVSSAVVFIINSIFYRVTFTTVFLKIYRKARKIQKKIK